MFLQRSYSAPVRVFDMSGTLVARATIGDAAWGRAVVRAVVVAAGRVVGVRVALRPDVDAKFRGVNAVVRGVVLRATVVDLRCWDAVVFVTALPDVRETAVPSRTAALATPMQSARFATKIRIFFISDVNVSKFTFFSASE